MLPWLKEAQPHVLGHPGAFTGVPQPGEPWSCLAVGCVGHRGPVWVALLEPGPGPPMASSSAGAVPTSPAGCARSLDTLKVHGAINTRAQGCQRGRPARGGC